MILLQISGPHDFSFNPYDIIIYSCLANRVRRFALAFAYLLEQQRSARWAKPWCARPSSTRNQHLAAALRWLYDPEKSMRFASGWCVFSPRFTTFEPPEAASWVL